MIDFATSLSSLSHNSSQAMGDSGSPSEASVQEELPSVLSGTRRSVLKRQSAKTGVRFSDSVVDHDDSETNLLAKSKLKRKKRKSGRPSSEMAASSTESSNATSVQLVRDFLSRQGSGLDPGLSRFRILYFTTVVLIVTMVVIVYFVRSNEITTFLDELVFTNKAGLRR